jgi:lysophospholipase L1-like esterase
MVGDSLTAIRAQATPAAFAAVNMSIHVDGVVSRRVPEEAPDPWSGVKTVRQLKAAGIDAPCWIVALGSNDLFWVRKTPGYGPTPAGTVDNYLDWMLDEIRVDGPRRVWWVNMNHYKYVVETLDFNKRLDERAAADPDLSAIDWFALSSENRQWFEDTVHVNAVGYDARAAFVAAALDAS